MLVLTTGHNVNILLNILLICTERIDTGLPYANMLILKMHYVEV